MLTPKEVQEHGFPRARKGYDMAEVDEFLDKLTEDYTTLYTNYAKLSSNYAKLRKKAQLLAQALEQNQAKTTALVEEATSKHIFAPAPAAAPTPAPAPAPAAAPAPQANPDDADELMRSARKDAEAIRSGARKEASEIIAKATERAAELLAQLQAESAAEEARLAGLKQNTADYIAQVRELTARQNSLLDTAAAGGEVPYAASAEDKEPSFAVNFGSLPEDVEEAPAAAEETPVEEVPVLTEQVEAEPEFNIPEEPAADDAAEIDDADDTGSLFDVIGGSEED